MRHVRLAVLVAFLLAASPAVFLFTASPVLAQDCGQFDLGWLACQQDADCALVKNACGRDAAYNKDHVEKAAAYNQCLSKQVDCTGPQEEARTVKAGCVENTCALVE